MKRISWIDTAKGLGILLVVLGHTCLPSLCIADRTVLWLYHFIYAFHMPVFFYLSGLLFFKKGKNEFSVFLKKKVNNLLVPYLAYVSFVYCIFALVSFAPKVQNMIGLDEYIYQLSFKSFIKDVILCSGTLDKHLWFIFSLFFIQIMAYFSCKNDWTLIISGFFFFIIGFYLMVYNSDTILFSIFYYYGYFILGRIDFYEYISKCKKKFVLLFCLGYFLMAGIYSYNIVVLQGYGRIAVSTAKVVLGLSGIIAFVGMINLLEGINCSLLRLLGSNSFVIYLYHQPFFATGFTLVTYKLCGQPLIAICVGTVLSILLSFVSDVFVSQIVFIMKHIVKKN